MRDTGFQPGCSSSSSSPHVDHADQLSGEVAQSERVQPEGDHPEQHLWRKPHGKHLRAERGWGGSRQAPRSRRRRRKEGGGPAPAAKRRRRPAGWSGGARPARPSAPRPARPDPALPRRQEMAVAPPPSRRDLVSAAGTAPACGRKAGTGRDTRAEAGGAVCSSRGP